MSSEWRLSGAEPTEVPAERLDALYTALSRAQQAAPLHGEDGTQQAATLPGGDRARQAAPQPRGAAAGDAVAVRRGVALAPHTSIRIGGPADLFLAATRVEHVVAALRAAHEHGVPCRVIGGASNLLVSDAGVTGLVVKSMLASPVRYVARAEAPGRVTAVAGAGYPLARLARESAKRGLAGLVWASNVPGTVGAAVVNNAGAFGGAMAEVLERALVVDAAGETAYLTPDDLAMAYRSTRLKRRELEAVVLEAEIGLSEGDLERLAGELRTVREQRRRTQPAGFSVGSTFTNPPGDSAGRLIDAAGLKGRRVGGAEVSPLHANFILNRGGATAEDVYTLMRAMQDAVYAQTSTWLVPEVQLLGRWPPEALAALAGPAEPTGGGPPQPVGGEPSAVAALPGSG